MSDTHDASAIKHVRGERFDVIVAALTAAATSVSFILAILTPPKGGPFCTGGCVEYPYTDIAAYIPRDFLWMYPALLPAPLFVMLLCGMHQRAAVDRKPFGRAAVAFGVMAATMLTAVYFIQLRYVQPAVLRGELDGLTPWTQYNPHGVFIALEEAGYLAMGVAFLFAGLALSTDSRVLRAVRTIFFLGFALLGTTLWRFPPCTASTWSIDSRSRQSRLTGPSSLLPERCWRLPTARRASLNQKGGHDDVLGGASRASNSNTASAATHRK